MAEERREGGNVPETASAGLGADMSGLLGGLPAGGGDVSEGILTVLRDPAMMAKLPAMIEMLRPMMGIAGGVERRETEPAPPRAQTPPEAPPRAEAGGQKEGGGKSGHDRRVALLCALRPYLSPQRQAAIDYILRMDQMGKLFRQR